jgi:hypothetical protein
MRSLHLFIDGWCFGCCRSGRHFQCCPFPAWNQQPASLKWNKKEVNSKRFEHVFMDFLWCQIFFCRCMITFRVSVFMLSSFQHYKFSQWIACKKKRHSFETLCMISWVIPVHNVWNFQLTPLHLGEAEEFLITLLNRYVYFNTKYTAKVKSTCMYQYIDW